MNTELIIESERWAPSAVTTMARVIHPDLGVPITAATITAAVLSVFDLMAVNPNEPVYEQELTVAEVVFDTYVADAVWHSSNPPDTLGYNFRHDLLEPAEQFDTIEGHVLRLRYELKRTGKASLWVVHERRLLGTLGG